MTIGASNTIPKWTVEGLKRLEMVDDSQQDKPCKDLHITTIRYLYTLVVERRNKVAILRHEP